MTIEEIRVMQRKLISLGYDLGSCGADGIAGKDTKAALVLFQFSVGVTTSGVATSETLQILDVKAREKQEELKAKYAEMQSKAAPRGLGWWVAFEAALSPGGEKEDLETGIERAKKTGASWVCLRAGDGTDNDKDFDLTSVRAWVDAGFDVYAWIFTRPDNTPREAAAYKRAYDKGCKGIVFNAEFEFLGETGDEARRLVEACRAYGIPFIAHAPPDYNGSENKEPWNALDAECDAILPQVYGPEHDDAGHVYHLTQVKKRYLDKGTPIHKVWPVLASYRPKTRGFTKGANGKMTARPTPPMTNEAQRVADDLLQGLGHEWVRSSLAPSIYSLDAISFINGSSDRVVATLSEAYEKALAEDKAKWEEHRALQADIAAAWQPKSFHEVYWELGA